MKDWLDGPSRRRLRATAPSPSYYLDMPPVLLLIEPPPLFIVPWSMDPPFMDPLSIEPEEFIEPDPLIEPDPFIASGYFFVSAVQFLSFCIALFDMF